MERQHSTGMRPTLDKTAPARRHSTGMRPTLDKIGK